MKKTKLKSTTLRTIMVITIVITISLSAAGFYYFQDNLRTFATTVKPIVSQSTAGNADPQAVKQLQNIITSAKGASDKSDQITYTAQDYQSQALKDLNQYATTNNITITASKFTQPASTGLINGIKSGTITITLKNPIPYPDLMRFFKSTESNLPKMQITGINMANSPNSNGMITIEPLTIELYVR